MTTWIPAILHTWHNIRAMKDDLYRRQIAVGGMLVGSML